MDTTEKKEGVSHLLKEIEKLIHKGIDTGKLDEYSPLELVHLAIHEVVNVAIAEQQLDEAFDKDDKNVKGKA
jgi:uncharacterized protein YktA (UPF0223 family)